MKLFNFLMATCLVLVLTFSNLQAQKIETKRNHFSIEAGLSYSGFDTNISNELELGFGSYFRLSNIINNSFGFYVSTGYTQSEFVDQDFYTVDGHIIGEYEVDLAFFTMSIGANWYFLTADVANEFSPYLGAKILMNFFALTQSFSNDYYNNPQISFGLDFRFAPTAGFNIPISKNLGLDIEGYLPIVATEVDIDDDFRVDLDYFTLSIGMKYIF